MKVSFLLHRSHEACIRPKGDGVTVSPACLQRMRAASGSAHSESGTIPTDDQATCLVKVTDYLLTTWFGREMYYKKVWADPSSGEEGNREEVNPAMMRSTSALLVLGVIKC